MRALNSSRFPIAVSIAVFSLLIASSVAMGETKRIGSLPGKAKNAGFTMQIDMEPLGGDGYQPIHLLFRPMGTAFPGERPLTIQIRPRAERGTDLDFQFQQEVVLPQGATNATFKLYVPHYYRWEFVTVRILENGRLIEKGDGTFHLNTPTQQSMGQLTSMGILVPKDEKTQDALWKIFPDMRSLVTSIGDGPLPRDTDVKRLSHFAANSFVESVQPGRLQFRRIDEESLHESWLGFSQLDVILVADPLLRRIESEQPSAMAAIRNWVTAGGNLWIYAVPPDDAESDGGASSQAWHTGLPTLERLPASSFVKPSESQANLQLGESNDLQIMEYNAWQGWYGPGTYGRSSGGERRQSLFDRMASEKNPMVDTVAPSELASKIRFGSFGSGRVMLIESDDPFPGSFQFWDSVNRIHGNRLRWVSRNGISVPLGNDSYWSWLIAAVGQPPVKSFVGLNTLFVVLIGPVLYFYLRRRDRLYLLYFSAPALAFVVTLGLFLYALVADGVSTRAKARKLTWVDLENDCVLHEMHHTYYTVLGSGNGLKFDSDVAVYPYRHGPVIDGYYYRNANGNVAGEGLINHGNDGVRFTGGFLPSRDQVQYVTVQPKNNVPTVSFQIDDGTPRVTNHLEQSLSDVLLCDASGVRWHVANLAAGATAKMQTVTTPMINEILDSDVFPNAANVPELRRDYYRYGYNPSAGYLNVVQTSELERSLKSFRRLMPAGSFIATTQLQDSDLGVPKARLSESAHVYFGELP
ncbi:hypothetical protein [Stieleria varia]|uniref:Uncharacterized protein n=1 Tax=Stieleria varia TaxID=2528005 RepID=A0A5C6B1B1_9BACT|nr:hypothetical protein [Stieleria varia]TWU05597.1 hypothetical protein Pla52n_13120 [Stieleria varia]